MTGPINFNIFKGVSGAENLYDIDKDKKKDGVPQQPEPPQPPAMQMNVGDDQDGEIDMSALDPEKFNKDLRNLN